ncbi:MAG: GNAT family N-acetyltransferase [Variovorax sp.]
MDAYQKPLYPPECHYGIDLAALAQPNVLFAVVRDEEATAVACGAIVLEDDLGELKRMYVDPSHRGRGIAGLLISFLEAEARAKGCPRFVLETGIYQSAAVSVYARAGYVKCGPFGRYPDDPFSVFMVKPA